MEKDSRAKHQRRNSGLQSPHCRKQTAAVVVLLLTGPIFAAVVLPALRDFFLVACLTPAFVVAWCSLLASSVYVMSVDPADPGVGSGGKSGIVDPFCGVCRIYVELKTRHCWDCNKCVSYFDHHCPWLNTCIGSRNYVGYCVVLGSLLMMLSILLLGTVLPLKEAFLDDGERREVSLYGLGETPSTGILCAVVLVYGPIWFLDAFLTAFHCMLVVEETTTYEFLTGRQPRMPGTPREDKCDVATCDAKSTASKSTVGPQSQSLLVANMRGFIWGSSSDVEHEEVLEPSELNELGLQQPLPADKDGQPQKPTPPSPATTAPAVVLDEDYRADPDSSTQAPSDDRERPLQLQTTLVQTPRSAAETPRSLSKTRPSPRGSRSYSLGSEARFEKVLPGSAPLPSGGAKPWQLAKQIPV
mmetsp:Transcript_43023/g.93684  ORF Transcript_43023/g.93684 Transcript_43023/m.93684 type:complete len:414 (-) Transcript_43023:295-1536(-)